MNNFSHEGEAVRQYTEWQPQLSLWFFYMCNMCQSFLTWSVGPEGLQQLQQQLFVCLCSSSCQLHPWSHMMGWLWTLHQIFIPFFLWLHHIDRHDENL